MVFSKLFTPRVEVEDLLLQLVTQVIDIPLEDTDKEYIELYTWMKGDLSETLQDYKQGIVKRKELQRCAFTIVFQLKDSTNPDSKHYPKILQLCEDLSRRNKALR